VGESLTSWASFWGVARLPPGMCPVGPTLLVLGRQYCEVLAVGRDISGQIMVATVDISRVSKNDKDLYRKISKVHLHDNMSISFYFCYAWRQQR